MKIRLGVCFGGISLEHEISILSALQAIAAVDKEKYEIIPIYISKQGKWYTGDPLLDLENYKDIDAMLADCREVTLSPGQGAKLMAAKTKAFKNPLVSELDVVLPVMHGAQGEDGCMQGLFELAGVPYAGPGVLAAAVGMDKIMMKAVLKDAGIPVVPQAVFSGRDWAEARAEVIEYVERSLPYPVIVKPANLGSSVGVGKAANRAELEEAIDLATSFSRRILVEEMIVDLRELNCAVLGMDGDAEASVCEEPVTAGAFLSYEDKYMSGGKGKGMSGAQRQIPANIPDELAKEVQELARRAFIALDGHGVARIDFLYDQKRQRLYVNEINTIPGSLSFYLWEAAGRSFSQLIDELLRLALRRQRDKEQLTTSYSVNILSMSGGSKAGIKK